MKVGGRDFDVSKEQVEEFMRGAEPEQIQKHAVEVNGEWFPPKQVLGHVTGWPRTTFTTMEAQRVLTRIGFTCTESRASLVRQAAQFAVDAVRDSAQQQVIDQGDAQFRRGFTRAASITQRHLQRRLDEFREQMKRAGLGPNEQAVFAHLDELKSDIEADCDRYWQRSGVDWRPPKQVAKATIRRKGEAEE